MKSLKQGKLNKVHNVLGIVVLAGIVCHGAARLAADILFPTEGLSMTANPDEVHDRIKLLQCAYHICNTCVFCFFVGNLDLLWLSYKRGTIADSGNRVVYYLKLIAAILICTGIFAVIDIDDWRDYFFPLWTALIAVVILLVLSTGAWLIERNKETE